MAFQFAGTGNPLPIITYAVPEIILNAFGLAGISVVGKLAQGALGVAYDNYVARYAPQVMCSRSM